MTTSSPDVAPLNPGAEGTGAQALPDRPLISTPPRHRSQALLDVERRRVARQPGLGLAGLLLVIPVAVLLAIAAGGPEPSVLVLSPIVTFALPAVAMIAFWWEDWPGSRLRPGWSGLVDTVIVAVAAILLTVLGQIVVGDLDLRGIFDPAPGPGHLATYPVTLPLAGAAFVAMLQLTLVWEGWPLRRLNRFVAGLLALAVAWGAAIVLYLLIVQVDPPAGSTLTAHTGPLSGGEYGAVLVLVGAWQVWLFVAWRGWPFAELRQKWLRIVAGNVVVIGGALLTFAVAHGLGAPAGNITAAAGSFVSAGLIIGMLFEGWLRSHLATLAAVVLLAAALYLLLGAYAASLHFTRATAEEWVGHASLNAIGISVVLHVAIGRRWPFGAGQETADRSD